MKTDTHGFSRPITDFQDYRDFLKMAFEEIQTKKQKRISLEAFARKLGISKSHFRYVLAKDRHISLDQVSAFTKAFGMNHWEMEAFTYLVCIGLAKTSDVKALFQAAISNIRYLVRPPTKIHHLSEEQSIKSWLPMVISTLVRFNDFEMNPGYIAKKLNNKNVSENEINEAVQFLINNKSIVQDESGRWVNSGFITSRSNFAGPWDMYVEAFRTAFPAFQDPDAYRPLLVHAYSLGFTKETFEQARSTFIDCFTQIIKLSQETKNPNLAVTFATMGASVAKADN